MSREPRGETLGALRASRDARRIATDVLLDRIVGMDTVRCVECGRPIAVATDRRAPGKDFEGRVICGICLRARENPHPPGIAYTTPYAEAPRLEVDVEDLQ